MSDTPASDIFEADQKRRDPLRPLIKERATLLAPLLIGPLYAGCDIAEGQSVCIDIQTGEVRPIPEG